MGKSFESHMNSFSEAMGVSHRQAQLQMTQPLANMVSLVHGPTFRAKALNWFFGDGLLEASFGREKLLEMVRAQAAQRTEVLPAKMPFGKMGAVQPSRKVAGMQQEMTRQLVQPNGLDPEEDQNSIQSQDLFSKEAWERKPILKYIQIEGKSIPDYYREHFEPRTMVIEYNPGVFKRYDLNEMRAVLDSHGLEPFYYGGFDGYIQFMEKGDYLPTHMKRSMYAPNGQHGMDLRPEQGVDDVRGMDRKGRPVINFQGGSVAYKDQANAIVDQMRGDFAKIMGDIEQNKPVNSLSPQQAERYRQLYMIQKVMKKQEQEVTGKGSGRKQAAASMGLPNSKTGAAIQSLPEQIDAKLFMQKVREGLALPRRAEKKTYLNPDAFGQWWDGTGPEPQGGYWTEDTMGGKVSRKDAQYILFRFNPKQQEDIFNYLFSEFDPNTRSYVSRFDANGSKIDSLEAAKPTNARIGITQLVNNAVKSDKDDAKGVKMIAYTMDGIDPTKYVSDQDYQSLPVDPMKPESDPTLKKLWDRGYRYDLNSPQERQAGVPDFEGRGVGYLSLKGSRYRIQKEKDGKFYLHVPVNRKGKPFKPADYGLVGKGWLAAGKHSFHGGIGSNHVNVNPAGAKSWSTLLAKLQQGELGEPGETFGDPTELPSVKTGVNAAKSYFAKKNNPEILNSLDQSEIDNWGVEGLKAFSGDPAFQVGYVTQQEWEEVLGWELNKEIENEEDWGEGRGLIAYMIRNGITNVEHQEKAIKYVMNSFGKEPIVPLHVFSELPQILAAFGENAFRARARAVRTYVFSKLNDYKKDYKAGRIGTQFSTLTGKSDAEGRGGEVHGRAVSGSGEYESGERQITSPQDLASLVGIKPEDQPANTDQKPASNKDDEFYNSLFGKKPAATLPKKEKAAPKEKVAPAKHSQEDDSYYNSLFGNKPAVAAQGVPKSAPVAKQGPSEDELAGFFRQSHAQRQQPVAQPPAPQATPSLQIRPDVYARAMAAKQRQAARLARPMESIESAADKFYRQVIAPEHDLYHSLFGETGAIYDGTKAKDGCGFNWEGAVGKMGGVSITGEPIGSGKATSARKRKRK